MKKTYRVVAVVAMLAIMAPFAQAHESRDYFIKGVRYSITVGSLNEPIVVDDKTGLDLSITRNGKPFDGAEKSLEVETWSGGVAKTFALTAAYGAPGKYKTTFFITMSDPLKYRIVGTLEDTPVDLVFSCNVAGHQMHAMEDTTKVVVSENVTQTMRRGAFGCPAPKSTYEFPAATVDQLTAATDSAHGRVANDVAFSVAVISLALTLGALYGRRRVGRDHHR